jgi:hypothetical protein
MKALENINIQTICNRWVDMYHRSLLACQQRDIFSF